MSTSNSNISLPGIEQLLPGVYLVQGSEIDMDLRLAL